MKVVMVSGFLNNHLSPLCQEFVAICDFTFIATQEQADSIKQRLQEEYVINYFEEENQPAANKLIEECDLAIFGGSAQELLDIRKKTGKPAFVYTERPFKSGRWRSLIPSTRKALRRQLLENAENVYVLCAGAYVAGDFKLLGFETKKCLKFGYFPQIQKMKTQADFHSQCIQMLYIGRFIPFKRVEDLIRASRVLRKEGFSFHLRIVGSGPKKKSLYRLTQKYQLFENIEFLEYAPHEEVLQMMNNSHILFLPSGKGEGWGAVINEAMGNGCVPICSNGGGGAPYLIENGVNGYVYRTGNIHELVECVKKYIQDPQKEKMHSQAYNTIDTLWNEKVAVQRLLAFSQSISEERTATTFVSGPISQAEVI